MRDRHQVSLWQPSLDRAQRIEEVHQTPEDFAALSGANVDFSPVHKQQWKIFWKEDICEKDLHHTSFPQLTLAEAKRVWVAMEDQFFANYEYFLRVLE